MSSRVVWFRLDSELNGIKLERTRKMKQTSIQRMGTCIFRTYLSFLEFHSVSVRQNKELNRPSDRSDLRKLIKSSAYHGRGI